MNAAAVGSFVIVNKRGMHARAAAKLVKLAARFEATIILEKDGESADAKSVMGVLLLCGQRGASLRVRAEGSDAVEALGAMGALIADGFGEED